MSPGNNSAYGLAQRRVRKIKQNYQSGGVKNEFKTT